VSGKEIINNNLHPFTKPPKVKSEHSAVRGFIEALIGGAHRVEQLLSVCQRCHRSHKPAVQHSSLSDVCPADSFGEELGRCFADVLEVKGGTSRFANLEK